MHVANTSHIYGIDWANARVAKMVPGYILGEENHRSHLDQEEP